MYRYILMSFISNIEKRIKKIITEHTERGKIKQEQKQQEKQR